MIRDLRFSQLIAAVVMSVQFNGFGATIFATNSLNQSIASADPGDTILISGPAIFHERVVVDKPLRIIATNSVAIDADGSGTPLTILATNVFVSGIIFRNGGHNLGKPDSGIMIRASDATIENCSVEDGGFGIYLHGVSNCRVENNFISGDTNLPPAQRGNGIHLWNAKHNIIAGNFITNTRDGAYFSYADANLIASNRIEHTRFGIHYMYSHQNRLIGNTLTANAVGAALMFARNCEVTDNRAFANRRHGILLKQVEHSRFARNEITGQNRGFFIQQAVANRFEENLISQNDIGLYLSNQSEENIFTGNSFVANTEQVWQPTDEFEKGRLASNQFSENGRGNFWSDYTGADANHDSIGDTPYHQTDAFGYIVNRHPEARVFALSPAAALLRKGEELVPLLDVPGVSDPAPLMEPKIAATAKNASAKEFSSLRSLRFLRLNSVSN
jgi:nitrous oxidase accessory protein